MFTASIDDTKTRLRTYISRLGMHMVAVCIPYRITIGHGRNWEYKSNEDVSNYVYHIYQSMLR